MSTSTAPNSFAFKLDRWEHSTVLAALIHYALTVAEPSECINCLEKLCPTPERPWDEMIHRSRTNLRAAIKVADDEVAAMRER